jgi:hypothetical protein
VIIRSTAASAADGSERRTSPWYLLDACSKS